jgi:hypothetical protein
MAKSRTRFAVGGSDGCWRPPERASGGGGAKGNGDLTGMSSAGEAKPMRGWSRVVIIRGRKVTGKPHGPAVKAKDEEGPINQYVDTVTFDNTLKDRLTP